MNILLVGINAKYIHSCLSIRCLLAYGKKYGYNVNITEYTINNREDEILKDIFLKTPDVVMFSCYIWNIDMVLRVSNNLKKILPNTKIILGGPEVSFDDLDILNKNKSVDIIMRGEGELTFLRLLDYFYNKSDINSVTGITYKKDNEIIKNPPTEALDLNDVPFAYSDLSEFKNRIIYYETQRGCPFGCSFCLSSRDRRVRFINTKRAIEEIGFFLENKVMQVKFVDRTFNCNKAHAMEIWRYIIENDNGITNFHMEIEASLIDEDMLRLLSHGREGLIQFEIGVQSTNHNTLRAINRNENFDKIKNVSKEIGKYKNIHRHIDLIAGLPLETIESFEKSFDEVYSLFPEQLQLGFLKVLKGSTIKNNANEYGIVYRENPPYEVLYTNTLSHREILLIKSIEEAIEIYYNSGKALNTLRIALGFFKSPYDMYKKIGEFMEERGYFKIQSSKGTTYTYLYEFFTNASETRDFKKLFIDAIVFDMLLNDNLNTYPSWAYEDDFDIMEKRRLLFNNENLRDRYLKDYRDIPTQQLIRQFKLRRFSYNISQIQNTTPNLIIPENNYILFNYLRKNTITRLSYFDIIKF